MCGIIGYIGPRDVTPVLMHGLRRLEYRGYDSAGICVVDNEKSLRIVRAVGKIAELQFRLQGKEPRGSAGIGHSRWATHGAPSEVNAHPHADCTGQVVVIHNGIIENYRELKEKLTRAGHHYASETDTEILAHLVEDKLRKLRRRIKDKQRRFIEATRSALREVEGAYAIAAIWAELPDTLIAAKTSSPLVIGRGKGEMFLASDVPAFMKYSREAYFLDDGEMAILERGGAEIRRLRSGRRHTPKFIKIDWDRGRAEKSGFKHFMLKEIYEQPQAVSDTIRQRLYPVGVRSLKRETGMSAAAIRKIERVQFLACGTANHAGMIGTYFIEHFAKIPAEAELASEFRYREPVLDERTLVVAISQSGETADTLAAVRLARRRGAKILSICNCVGSALTRTADFNLHTHCGPEYGVASTKAFVGQLTAIAILTLHLGIAKRTMDDQRGRALIRGLRHLPEMIHKTLKLDRQILALAKKLKKKKQFLFIGRHVDYPLALEGALKLKEISYLHAEGYAAGEMKHGPIALIDQDIPVIAIATESRIFEKTFSNIEEAKARGAMVIAIASEGERRLRGKADYVLSVPKVDEYLSPLVSAVPLQLLAYHISNQLGLDVDQPRNLAKSVTVE
ncbi:MAG: glutamine--fructose-6-phosphate transaminase (isomerizing) [Elusimicrobiota bacterium]